MSTRPNAASETLDIPQWMRDEIDARDGTYCRSCGRFLGGERAIHHIHFGLGVGARRQHAVDNLITLCWLYPIAYGIPPCHDRVHSEKKLWIPYLEQAIARPGTTALQLRRWAERRRR